MQSTLLPYTCCADAFGHGFVLLDGTTIVYANRAATNLCATEREGMLNRPVLDFVASKHHKKLTSWIHAYIQGDTAASSSKPFLCTFIASSGIEYMVEMTLRTITQEDRTLLAGTLLDVTRKIKTERKLQRILDSMPEAIIAFDRTHSIIESANDATEGIYGIPTDQFENNIFHPIDLVHPQDAQEVQAFYEQLIENEFDRIEYRIIHANGETRWVRDEGEVIYVEQGHGRIQHVYHFIKDITDRKADEEKLRLSELKYRSIFETSTDPIYVVAPNGRFLDINEAAIKLFEFHDKADAKTRNITDHFLHSQERTAILQHIDAHGSITDHPTQLKTVSGKIVEVLITAGCKKNCKSGLLESYLVILHDMRPVIERTELETYRRTLGGLSDRLNNIVQAQLMQHGLMDDYINALLDGSHDSRQEHLLLRLQTKIRDAQLSLQDLQILGDKIRKIYHAPEPPTPVSDGAGGILFDLK